MHWKIYRLYFIKCKVHIINMINILPFIVLIVSLVGCKSLPQEAGRDQDQEIRFLISHARQLLAQQDLYAAKRAVSKILELRPGDSEAENLMAEVINAEIEVQKESEDPKVLEEYSAEELKNAVKTWLERSRTLLSVQAYEQAALAAEKVFTFDPQNYDASKLLDEIRESAMRAGKEENLLIGKMYQEEIEDRIDAYLRQAKREIARSRYGMATLALEKILLLQPENREALQLYEQLKIQKG